MPTIELTDEELQGFVHLCATASGPGVSWMLTNALLTKARLAQEAAQHEHVAQVVTANVLKATGNSEDHDAAVPRAT